MKFYETHFDDYISTSEKNNLHPTMNKILDKFPKKMDHLRNIIFYGASGIGKYTLMLKSIKKYSPSELKYEKKISITYNKEPFFLKISDIHYEIDMSLLGCNSKLLWHDIYTQIIDIVATKAEKCGIIVCQNFQEIHSELLDIFYSYMQNINAHFVDIKFILLTEELSFIPDNILNACEILHVKRPTQTLYKKCIQANKSCIVTAAVTTAPVKEKKIDNKTIAFAVDNITNIKNAFNANTMNDEKTLQEITNIMTPYKMICNKIIDSIIHIEDLKFLKFRDLLYDIFIYNLDITDCIWYIVTTFLEQKRIVFKDITPLLMKTYSFFQYYNNNYRPIYHVENYMFYLATLIHYNESSNNQV